MTKDPTHTGLNSDAQVPEVLEYLRRYEPIEDLPRAALLAEMDRVWDDCGLDNRIPLASQIDRVGRFYGHPVWILNGIFAERDAISRSHRTAIAHHVLRLGATRIADYGGGSGVLARIIASLAPSSQIDIVEPYPFPYFLAALKGQPRVRFVESLGSDYEVVIAQDVLEHVDDPVETAMKLAIATKPGGILIFANSFWPEIKCHLPATFYLRHQFSLVMRAAGLEYLGRIDGLPHGQLFRTGPEVNATAAHRAAKLASLTGPALNDVRAVLARIRRGVARTHETQ